MARAILTLEERFMSKVEPEPNTGCWLWTGSLFHCGYGQIQISSPRRVNAYAHRVAWELFRGEIPRGLQVLHTCDVRSCCSVDHLFLGTNQDNHSDKAAKGRGRKSKLGLPFGVRRDHGMRTNPFQARVRFHGRYHHLGYFSTAELASAVSLAFKRSLYNAHAQINGATGTTKGA